MGRRRQERDENVSQIGIFWCPLCGEKERRFQGGEGNPEGREGPCSHHVKAPRRSPLKHPAVTQLGSAHSNLATLAGQAEEDLKVNVLESPWASQPLGLWLGSLYTGNMTLYQGLLSSRQDPTLTTVDPVRPAHRQGPMWCLFAREAAWPWPRWERPACESCQLHSSAGNGEQGQLDEGLVLEPSVADSAEPADPPAPTNFRWCAQQPFLLMLRHMLRERKGDKRWYLSDYVMTLKWTIQIRPLLFPDGLFISTIVWLGSGKGEWWWIVWAP